MKKLRISILALVLGAIFSVGLFGFSNPKTVYAEESYSRESYYLISADETTPYKANQAVGSTSGYGDFRVGAENVTLTAQANDGFKVVGWLIDGTFYDTTETSLEFTATNASGDEKTATITITYSDTNSDEQNDTTSLAISEVFKDMTIEPVFDHIYYLISLNDVVDLIKLPSYSMPFGTFTAYCTSYTADVDGYALASNTILVNANGDHFYVGDVYLQGGNAYGKHTRLDDAETTEYIDLVAKDGAFRLGDIVEFSVDINITSNVYTSKNIDVIGATLNGNDLTKANILETNNYKLTKDAYNRTTNVAFNVEIEHNVVNTSCLWNTINLNYHNLYVVTINRQIDGEDEEDLDYTANLYENVTINTNTYSKLYEVDGEYFYFNNNARIPVSLTTDQISALPTPSTHTFNDAKDLFSVETYSNGGGFITVHDAYAQYSETIYLVKKAADNGNRSFQIECSSSYSENSLGSNYIYYTFKTLTNADGYSAANSKASYSNFDGNKTININYSTKEYAINFETAIINSNGSLSSAALTGIESVTVKHANSATINTYGSNVGYNFMGYTTALSNTTLTENSINVKINRINPTNRIIYLVYELIDYTLEIQNLNKISIGSVYSLSSLTLNYVRGLNSYSEQANLTDLTNYTTTFTTQFNINDVITLIASKNNGFNFYGFSFDSAETDYANCINGFTLNEDIINSLTEGSTTIVLYAYEDYIYYTLTYQINLTKDTSTEPATELIMAEISATAPTGAVVVQKNVAGEDISDSSVTDKVVATIEITNLKYNDVVTLSSVGKQITSESQYMFIWFTADNRTELSSSSSGEKPNVTYTHEETIFMDRTITVVYSTPKATLTIATTQDVNGNDVYDLTQITVTSAGEAKSLEEGVYNITANSTVVVTLTSNPSFGYKLTGYTLNGVYTASTTYSFTFQALEESHILTINFTPIEYRFVIEQNGAGFENSQYNFGTTENPIYYTSLNVENTTLTFNKPLGYYVRAVIATDGVASGEWASLLESNDSRNEASTLYEVEITDFATLVQTYASNIVDNVQVITLKITYSIYMYEIKVGYQIPNQSYIDQLTLPTFSAEGYTQSYSNDSYKTQIFYVPYGTTFTINVTKDNLGVTKFVSWERQGGLTATSSSELTLILDVTEDSSYHYVLEYEEYTISLIYNTNHGEVEMLIGGNQTTTITQFKTLTINTSAKLGYVFRYFAYKYNYTTEANWNTDCSNLYVLDNGEYVLNTSETYNSNLEYFVLKTSIYDEIFYLANYVVEADNKTIQINVEFDTLKVYITNTPAEYSKSATISDSGTGPYAKDINILLSDYASYTIYAEKDGQTREITSTDYVTVEDVVYIKVQINDNALNQKDGKSYNLIGNLKLNSVSVSFKTFDKNDTNGIYKITINMKDENVIKNVTTNNAREELNITYIYTLSTPTLTVITNINNSNFYNKIDFWVNYSYNYGSGYTGHSGNSCTSTLQFLGKADVYYDLNDYTSWFKLEAFNITINGNTQLVTKAFYNEHAEDLRITYGIEKVEFISGTNQIDYITIRYIDNIEVTLIMQPIIYFEGNEVTAGMTHTFTKEFKYSSGETGEINDLTVGQSSTGYDIGIPTNIPTGQVKLTYSLINSDGSATPKDPINVGTYKVKIAFDSTGTYSWLSSITLEVDVKLEIIPKSLYVQIDSNKVGSYEKTYNGSYLLTGANVSASDLINALYFKDKSGSSFSSIELTETDISAFISINTTNTDGSIGQAYISNVGTGYNITLANVQLYINDLNKNFVLINSNGKETTSLNVVFEKVIKITPATLNLVLTNATVLNKVYDGNTSANFLVGSSVGLKGVVSGDAVTVNINKILLNFETAEIGNNKVVYIDPTGAIEGASASNYVINTASVSNKIIYPYSLTYNVEGFGEISLYNRRGLEDASKANLIPLGSELKVKVVYPDTSEFTELYGSIDSYISRRNAFVVGYIITLEVYGQEQNISNELYLSVPDVEKLSNLLFITGEEVNEVDFTNQGDYIIIDLSQLQFKLNTVVLTQKQALLQLWQIILIVVGSVVIVGGAVAAIVIIRIKKKRRDEIFDKI